MANGIGLKVVNNQQIEEAKAAEAALKMPKASELTGLVSHLNDMWSDYRWHNEKTHKRAKAGLRAYKSEYSPDKLAEIKKFQGSQVYSGITSVKCRSATSLLRDVFLGPDKAWGIKATPIPNVPEDITTNINQLVIQEAIQMQQQGTTPSPQQIKRRRTKLLEEARKAIKKDAAVQSKTAEERIDDLLTEGNFYRAFIEFLSDLPIFPYAILKGPVVSQSKELRWIQGELQLVSIPRMFWHRVSPLDIYFAPGASRVDDSGIFEHIRISRMELQNLRDLPGYNKDAIENILREYESGWYLANTDDGERANLENREAPSTNTNHMLDGLEYQGPISGRLLREYGFTTRQVPDENIEYNVSLWWIGRHVFKAHLNPNPTRANNYYVTSYEKLPGSIPGNGITDIISHVQQVANACLRSLVNNMSISSGPQVIVNEDRISTHTNPDSLYPWKRWRFTADVFGNSEKPIDFFQPASNAQDLLGVYAQMSNIADDISAIPKFLSGSEKVGGAARTASGLSMLINNASKMLQTVASNIDKDIMEPLITDLFNIMVLTDGTGTFTGDSKVVVNGVKVATQHETDRLRKLEFLQLTANEIDAQIVGPQGRAAILRDIADDLGMPGANIVPDLDDISPSPSPGVPPNQIPAPQEGGGRPAEAVEGITQQRRLPE